ncbi:MAG: hypothetical protein ACI4V7_12470 [Succinivibrionaceae bacterium]
MTYIKKNNSEVTYEKFLDFINDYYLINDKNKNKKINVFIRDLKKVLNANENETITLCEPTITFLKEYFFDFIGKKMSDYIRGIGPKFVIQQNDFAKGVNFHAIIHDCFKNIIDQNLLEIITDADRLTLAKLIKNEKINKKSVTENYNLILAGKNIYYKNQQLSNTNDFPLYININEFCENIEISTIKQIVIEENMATFLKFFNYSFDKNDDFINYLDNTLVIFRSESKTTTKEMKLSYADTLTKKLLELNLSKNSDNNIKVYLNSDLDKGGYDWTNSWFKNFSKYNNTYLLLPTQSSITEENYLSYGKKIEDNLYKDLECYINTLATTTRESEAISALKHIVNITNKTNKTLIQESIMQYGNVFKLKSFKI